MTGVVRGWTLHEVDSYVISEIYERERRRLEFACEFRDELEREANIVKRVSLEDGTIIYEAKSMNRQRLLSVALIVLTAIVASLFTGWLLRSFFHYRMCPASTSYVIQAYACVFSIKP